MPDKIYFYGDGEIWPHWPVAVFYEEGVVCDYTECGAYVCGKHARVIGREPEEATWAEAVEKLIELYGEDTPVEAHNNGIASQFQRYGIRTLGDLRRFLAERKRL